MLVEQANKIIDNYSKWVISNMFAVQQGNAVRIITPMLDRNNDCMSILIGESPNGGYSLTDLGETISDLELSGLTLSSETRSAKLDQVLAGFGVSKTDANELFISASDDDISIKMNMMLQAMISVDDLFFLNKDSVRSLFFEDVGMWMYEHNIKPIAGPSYVGRSGLYYKFDYAIAGAKINELKLIKTVNNPTETNVCNALFGWKDVESSRKGSTGYIFLNSRNGKNGKIEQSVISACSAYGMKPIQWGINENAYIGELAA
ncbi:DUF1828 domain-containing protein [Atopobium sp. oral taxon 199]|uniref:DUF1828 domain-containing protein n=1 Tax=Atopobium sp. oral taxon 199 TaxID=712156 RepID=UPI00034E667F|nr:DUF1828 domain-containing protein [Atopobium sp. oral taxon 199]EPD78784.1 hypothetical protein HMPREF1527_01121 [Atopobium sp. oral taxon 199 str. F0494]